MLTPKSGLFLMISCIAAIAAVGSVFELAYGHPKYGESLTWGFLVASIPATVASFYAAVRNARRGS